MKISEFYTQLLNLELSFKLQKIHTSRIEYLRSVIHFYQRDKLESILDEMELNASMQELPLVEEVYSLVEKLEQYAKRDELLSLELDKISEAALEQPSLRESVDSLMTKIMISPLQQVTREPTPDSFIQKITLDSTTSIPIYGNYHVWIEDKSSMILRLVPDTIFTQRVKTFMESYTEKYPVMCFDKHKYKEESTTQKHQTDLAGTIHTTILI